MSLATALSSKNEANARRRRLRRRQHVVALVLREHADGDRRRDLRGELLPPELLDDVHVATVAAEQAIEQVVRPVAESRRVQRLADRLQHVLADYPEDGIVAGEIKALAELLLRKQRDVGALALDPERADDEIGGAAADIERRQPERLRCGAVHPVAGVPHDVEEGARVTRIVQRDLAVEVDRLRGARLVPLQDHRRQRRIRVRLEHRGRLSVRRRLGLGGAGAEIHEIARRLRLPLHDLPFGQRHRRRHGHDDPPAAGAAGRRCGGAAGAMARSSCRSPARRSRRARTTSGCAARRARGSTETTTRRWPDAHTGSCGWPRRRRSPG